MPPGTQCGEMPEPGFKPWQPGFKDMDSALSTLPCMRGGRRLVGGAGRNDKETKRGGQDAERQTTGSIISPQECLTLTMYLFLQLLIL